MTPSLRVAALTVLAMLAFAGNSLLCRVALRDTAIDAGSFTAIRLVSGALLLAALMASRGKRPTSGGSWRAALMLFSYAAFFSFAYRELSAATGALLLFGAVQTGMLAWGLYKGERLRPLQLGGLALAIGGLIYMLLPGLASPPLGGALLMMAAGLSWAVYSLLGRGGGDPTAGTAGNFLRSVPFAVALALATHLQARLDMTGLDTTGIVYAVISGAITSGLGYVLWYAVLPSFTAAAAAVIQLSVPAIAAVGGMVLLSEPLSSRLVIASAAILGGIALTILRPRT
jgi:drug/metabolite transporter (DMT)-like permease